MELSSVQIAKLVLGYLKLEKCHSLYNDFLNASPYLKEFNNPKKRKYIVTRVLGQSLVDILKDYAIIYTIIQERLEESNFYNEERTTTKLSNQLVYLLDGQMPSRSSSPTSNCRSSTPNKNITHSPNISDIVPDVNTTPLDNLPGNSETTPKRKIPISANRSHRLNPNELELNKSTDKSTEENGTSPEAEEEIHIEKALDAFAQTLLGHQELQEKIARNINSVRHSDGEVREVENERNDDIDKAIKAVLEKTESDPAFESLIGEIIGTVADTRDVQSQESHNQPFNILCDMVAEKKDPAVCQTTDVNQKLSVNTNTGDITIYHGTMENYVTNDSLTPQSIMLNPSNLLLMTTNQNHTYTPSTTLDPTKPLLLNNQLILPTTQPQSYIVNKILTEQDILAMPTVIVTEEKPKPKSKKAEKKLRNIVPKFNKTDNIADYLKLYKSSEDDVKKQRPAAIIQMEIIQEDPLPTIPSEETKNLDMPVAEIVPEETEENVVTKEIKSNDVVVKEDTEVINQGRSKSLEKGPVGVAKTPPDNKSRKRSVSTPRSGNRSHVRALDFKFETPAKEKIAVKRAGTSPKVTRKSPVKSLSKSVKTLFTSPAKSPAKKRKVEVKKVVKKANSWDADLRALASTSEETKNVLPKKKPVPKKKVVKEDLNKTEDDALKIEAAILEKTPEEKVPARRARSKSTRSAKSAEEAVAEKHEEQDLEKNVEHINLRNCNSKPKYKKKCNIDGTFKKDVKVTAVKEIKTLESTGDKLVLSPSGLNANKRSLMEVDEKKTLVEKKDGTNHPRVNMEAVVERLEDILPSTKAKISPEITEKEPYVSLERVDQEVKKFLTPEMAKIPSQIPSTSKKNLIPMLETPIKDMIPKTPGFLSPVSIQDTPFTKVFKEQLQGVDISSIPTPKFPLTPNFPFTPLIENQSPYNRPTDYSTSSSYYQPSDTEQNKSLELLIIEECKRLESKKTPIREEPNVQNPETPSDLLKEDSTNKVIADKMKSMSSNIIARKNLSLVNRNGDSSDESSSSESETDSSDDESSSSDEDNQTVVERRESREGSVTRYSLRSKDKIEETKKVESVERVVDVKAIECELGRIVGEAVRVEEEKVDAAVEIVDGHRIETVGIQTVETVQIVEAEGNENIKAVDKSIRLSKTVECSKAKLTKSFKNKPRVSPKNSNRTAKGGTRGGKKIEQTGKGVAKKVEISEGTGDGTSKKGNTRVGKLCSVEEMEEQMENLEENSKKPDNIIKSIIENTNFKPQLEKAAVPELPSYQEKVLREMEEKRKRTIAMFKNENNIEVETEKVKPRKGKILTKRSLRSNSKAGKLEEEIQPFQVVETEFSEIENDEVVIKETPETSDRDAEILVKGLKQWGIHLVHNKSPKTPKKSKDLERVENLGEVEINIVEAETKNSSSVQDEIKGESGRRASKKWRINPVQEKPSKPWNKSTNLDKVEELGEVEIKLIKEQEKLKSYEDEIKGGSFARAKALKQWGGTEVLNSPQVLNKMTKVDLDKVENLEIKVSGESLSSNEATKGEKTKTSGVQKSPKVSNVEDLEEGEIRDDEEKTPKGNKRVEDGVKSENSGRSRGKVGVKGRVEKTPRGKRKNSQKMEDEDEKARSFLEEIKEKINQKKSVRSARKKVEEIFRKRVTRSDNVSKNDSLTEIKEGLNVKNDSLTDLQEASNFKNDSFVEHVIDKLNVKTDNTIVRNESLTGSQKELSKNDNLTGNVKVTNNKRTIDKTDSLEKNSKEMSNEKNVSLTSNDTEMPNVKSDSLIPIDREVLKILEKPENDSLLQGVAEIVKQIPLYVKDYVCQTDSSSKKPDSLTMREKPDCSTIAETASSLTKNPASLMEKSDSLTLDKPESSTIDKPESLTIDKIVGLTASTGAIKKVLTSNSSKVSTDVTLTEPGATSNISTMPNKPSDILTAPNPTSDTSIDDIPFDTKSWVNTDNLDLVLYHDPDSVKRNYDLQLNDKVVTIGIYIEELDMEVDKRLKVSPFHWAINHQPINILIPKRKPPPTIKKKSRPLNVLYTELIGDDSMSGSSTQGSQHSPLDELYDVQRSSYGRGRRVKKAEPKKISRVEAERERRRSQAKEEEDRRSLSTNKRKGEEQEGEAKKAKTDNCQELLKAVNVDDFLKKVHGEVSQEK